MNQEDTGKGSGNPSSSSPSSPTSSSLSKTTTTVQPSSTIAVATVSEPMVNKIVGGNSSSSSEPGTSAYSTPRSSSERLDITEETLKYQEKLISQCKNRMKDKFDELEKETGVKLRRYWSEKETDDHSEADCHGSGEDDEDSSESNATRPVKEGTPSSTAESTVTMTDGPIVTTTAKESRQFEEIQVLRRQLDKTQDELKAKDAEIVKLARIRSQVEYELEDLTASLFEEANKMVRAANVKKAKFERDYKEAMMKMHVLQAEVEALKVLVITSTPSTPNKHLHPHLEGSRNNHKGELLASWRARLSPFPRLPRLVKSNSNQVTPRKSPSNYELGGSPGISYESNGIICDLDPEMVNSSSIGEVDPVLHQQFSEWRKNPSLDKSSKFIGSIYEHEVYPVFNFKNRSLTELVLSSIEDNSIAIESVSDKTPFPKKCALLDIPRTCKYRMKLGKDSYNISQLCRNRITAVCDLFCYLRYIQQGLVKSSFHDVYWEIMQRRKNIALSRLGFPAS